MTENEKYIYDLTNTLDYEISIHRCPEFANGSIFIDLIYKNQRHVMVLNKEQANVISFLLHHASIKLEEELKELA